MAFLLLSTVDLLGLEKKKLSLAWIFFMRPSPEVASKK